MKKILLIDNDPQLVADLQSKFARHYEILATDNYKTAYQLIKATPFESILAQIPENQFSEKHNDLKKLLKKLKRKKFSAITKILITSKGGEHRVEEFLNLGIAAVVVDVGEVGRWIN